jgi:hypothetical protein
MRAARDAPTPLVEPVELAECVSKVFQDLL